MIQNIVKEILKKVKDLQSENLRLLIAIEGRSNAGKTTLSKDLQEILNCNIIHMDHFFLPHTLREREANAKHGSNIDFDRLQKDVISPLKNGEPFSYRPFNCALQQYAEEIFFLPKAVNIIEGAYSCHPRLWQNYDMRIFLDITSEEQRRRVLLRENAKNAEAFFEIWIPREEAYFTEYDIVARCNHYFKAGV